jgi:hypothetical protein
LATASATFTLSPCSSRSITWPSFKSRGLNHAESSCGCWFFDWSQNKYLWVLDWNLRTNILPFVGDLFESEWLYSYGVNVPSPGTIVRSISGRFIETPRGRQQKCTRSSSSKR